MPVTGIDHVNIRTMDVATSARFYVDLLGFEYRQEPVMPGRLSNWLYDDRGNPIIHFRVMEPGSESTGPIDHVALRCQGVAQVVERLKARDIAFSMTEGLRPGVTQIVLKDPHGINLELNFADG